MSLEDATIYSVNTVYAQVIHELGAANVVATAQRMGLRCCTNVGEPKTPLHPFDSAVLGTNEVNSLEMASAYGTLATGGQHVEPVPAVSISDAEGDVVWQAHPDPQQVIDPKIASVADGILRNVVLYGTGKAANIGRPQIGKTGTAQDFANAWFIGAVPQLVTAVWVGFHQGNIDMVPPTTRIAVYGGTWPADIWRLFMLRATAGMPPSPFPVPQVGYVSEAVDVTQDPYCLPNRYTLPINIRTMQFFQGTQPTKVCTTPTASQPLILPSVIGLAHEGCDLGAGAGGVQRAGGRDDVQPAPGDRRVPDAIGGHHGTVLLHGADHGRSGARRFRLGGPGRPRETNGSSRTRKRHGRSSPTRTPTRVPARISAELAGVPCSIHTFAPRTRSDPSSARVTSKAWQSFPGPEQRSVSPVRPRRAAISADPSSGSTARSRTALARPVSRVTTFIIQWLP